MGIMKEISVKALAKINLGLDVVRRREDGYHEVKMVMQTIHLFDRLEMKKTAGGITMTTNLSFLPTNENNLVYKAAKLLMDEFQIRDGIDVKLHKYIPVAAGMAGGSTDAAAVLYGMNRMFELGLSKEELMQRGVKIGADVPYCIMRGTALAEGIGEQLTALPPMVKCPILIAKPQISVSTKFVYENLKLDENTVHPDIDRLVEDIRRKDLAAITSDMGKHDFCYRIVPHAGNHLDAGINRRAFEFNVPLKKTALPQQFDGRIDAVIQKAAEKKTLYVQAVKMSEDEKNIIIRLSEQDGTRGKLVLPFAVQPVNLLEDSEGERTDVIVYHPFELVSFAIPVLPE